MTDAYDLTPTLDQADAYFETRPRSDAWRDATELEKTRALAYAALVLDACFEFSDAARYESGEWRPRIVAAVCEQALWILTRKDGGAERLASLGVTSASVAGISATFDRREASALVCDAARRLIGRLGRFVPLDEGGGEITSTPLAL